MIKKLSLGAVSATASSTRPVHPTVEITDAETNALFEQWLSVNPQFKTLKNQNETLAKQLAPRIKALFFNRFAGLTAASSTILVQIAGRTVKLITKNAYTTTVTDEAALIEAIGADKTAEWFKQATVLKLELDKVPDDKQEAFATGVIELAQKMGVTDAVSVKQCIQPKAGFHDARTTILTAEENIALDNVLPITAYPQL